MIRSTVLSAILATALTAALSSAAMAAEASHAEDNRATAALNLLENNGYGIPLGSRNPLGSYAQFETDGPGFSAYAVRDGVARKLHIDPDAGGISR